MHYPRFNGYSFLEIPSIPLNNDKDIIRILFHTVHADGVLLYAFNNHHDDHLKVLVKNGRLAVSISTGGVDAVTIVTDKRVDMGETISAVLK